MTTQIIPASADLGPAYTGLSIGYRVLNLDATTYSAFTTTNVVETSVSGLYRVTGGVTCPTAGGYIIWGVSGTDYAEIAVDPVVDFTSAQAASAAVTTWTYAGGTAVSVRSQDSLLSEIEDILDDNSNERWSDTRIYRAINRSIDMWTNTAMIPFAHTVSGGWVAGTYQYALPDFMETRFIQPQIWKYVNEDFYYLDNTGDGETWADILAFTVEPNTSGGSTLRLHYDSYTDDGRILWWGNNGRIPTTPGVLNANIDSDDTTLTLSWKPNVGRYGYIKINSEWLAYFGTTENTATLTLNSLSRGLFGTTAASHTTSDTVYWGVAVEDNSLFRQLEDQTLVHLMQHYLMNTSSRETAQYEKLFVAFQDRANNFWRSYRPKRKTKVRLDRAAIGGNV